MLNKNNIIMIQEEFNEIWNNFDETTKVNVWNTYVEEVGSDYEVLRVDDVDVFKEYIKETNNTFNDKCKYTDTYAWNDDYGNIVTSSDIGDTPINSETIFNYEQNSPGFLEDFL